MADGHTSVASRRTSSTSLYTSAARASATGAGAAAPSLSLLGSSKSRQRAAHAGATAPRLPNRMDVSSQLAALEEFRSVVSVGAGNLRRFKEAAAEQEEEQRRRELRVAWSAEAESLAREATTIAASLDSALDSLSNHLLLLEGTYDEEGGRGSGTHNVSSLEALAGANMAHNARLAFRRVVNGAAVMAEELQQLADDVKTPIDAARSNAVALRKAVNHKTKEGLKEKGNTNIAKARAMLSDTDLFPRELPSDSDTKMATNDDKGSGRQQQKRDDENEESIEEGEQENNGGRGSSRRTGRGDSDITMNTFDFDSASILCSSSTADMPPLGLRTLVESKMKSLRSTFGLLERRYEQSEQQQLMIDDGPDGVRSSAALGSSQQLLLCARNDGGDEEKSSFVQQIQNLARQRQAAQKCRQRGARIGLVDVIVNATDESVRRVRDLVDRTNRKDDEAKSKKRPQHEVFLTEPNSTDSSDVPGAKGSMSQKLAAISSSMKKHEEILREGQADHATFIKSCQHRLAPAALSAPKVHRAAVDAAAAFEDLVAQDALKSEQTQEKYRIEIEAARQQFLDATATLDPSEVEAVIQLCRTYTKPSLLVGKGHVIFFSMIPFPPISYFKKQRSHTRTKFGFRRKSNLVKQVTERRKEQKIHIRQFFLKNIYINVIEKHRRSCNNNLFFNSISFLKYI